MPGQRPDMHIKTKPAEGEGLSEIGIAWQKNSTFFSGVTKVDIPAGTNIMVFIDKPKEPEPKKGRVKQAAKNTAA